MSTMEKPQAYPINLTRWIWENYEHKFPKVMSLTDLAALKSHANKIVRDEKEFENISNVTLYAAVNHSMIPRGKMREFRFPPRCEVEELARRFPRIAAEQYPMRYPPAWMSKYTTKVWKGGNNGIAVRSRSSTISTGIAPPQTNTPNSQQAAQPAGSTSRDSRPVSIKSTSRVASRDVSPSKADVTGKTAVPQKGNDKMKPRARPPRGVVTGNGCPVRPQDPFATSPAGFPSIPEVVKSEPNTTVIPGPYPDEELDFSETSTLITAKESSDESEPDVKIDGEAVPAKENQPPAAEREIASLTVRHNENGPPAVEQEPVSPPARQTENRTPVIQQEATPLTVRHNENGPPVDEHESVPLPLRKSEHRPVVVEPKAVPLPVGQTEIRPPVVEQDPAPSPLRERENLPSVAKQGPAPLATRQTENRPAVVKQGLAPLPVRQNENRPPVAKQTAVAPPSRPVQDTRQSVAPQAPRGIKPTQDARLQECPVQDVRQQGNMTTTFLKPTLHPNDDAWTEGQPERRPLGFRPQFGGHGRPQGPGGFQGGFGGPRRDRDGRGFHSDAAPFGSDDYLQRSLKINDTTKVKSNPEWDAYDKAKLAGGNETESNKAGKVRIHIDQLLEALPATYEEEVASKNADILSTAPLFAGSVSKIDGEVTIPQYALLGQSRDPVVQFSEGATTLEGTSNTSQRQAILLNTNIPQSMFVCGLQGGGKSHTLSVCLENMLIPSGLIGSKGRPLAACVFHYASFSSVGFFKPCEAAFLAVPSSTAKGISQVREVNVLVSRSNLGPMRQAYAQIPGVNVYPLLLRPSQLNVKIMLDLMGVGEDPPLYMQVVTKILREMAAKVDSPFDYKVFKELMSNQQLTPAQRAPLDLRIQLLESFMGSDDNPNLLDVKEGCITVVDMSCPFVDRETACVMFSTCLEIFMSSTKGCGKVVALDEAHKYLTTNSLAAKGFTEQLVQHIRLQRHEGVRTIVSTQDPVVSTELIELCSVVVMHRFTSPAWFSILKKHIGFDEGSMSLKSAADGDLIAKPTTEDAAKAFNTIMALRTGEAMVYCPLMAVARTEPKPAVAANEGEDGDDVRDEAAPEYNTVLNRVGGQLVKVAVRGRITLDGGRSMVVSRQ